MIVVRGRTIKPVSSKLLASYFDSRTDIDGYFYLGYPLIGTGDDTYPIEGLLLSKQHGAVIFHLIEGNYNLEKSQEISVIQDDVYNKLESKLKAHTELTKKKNLAVNLSVVTYAPAWDNYAQIDGDYPILVSDNDLSKYLNKTQWQDNQYHEKLISIIQSITTIRNRTKRDYVKKIDSRGYKLKQLEDSIATLDKRQNKAVIETVEGVQRIRGLAGSGKTIVLALKVAYLHSVQRDWKIAVTFNSRSLKDMFEYFITKFTGQSSEDFKSKIDIIHAWGSPKTSGIYYDICLKHNIEYYDFAKAKEIAGNKEEFDVVCEKAYQEIKEFQPYYDAILIDEAQDFSPYFIRLCYGILKEPKNLVYAYDELQNLSNKQMLSPEELFGINPEGNPVVSFTDSPNVAERDVILEVCYRNSRPLLATAHALGFGIYKKGGLVQFFEQHQLWQDVGYKVIDGELKDNHKVTLIRDEESSPEFLENHSSIDDLIIFKSFNNNDEQINHLVAEIEKNIREDELLPSDIMVIHPDAYTIRTAVGAIREKLSLKGINSELVGVTTTPDQFNKKDTVVFTQIYRAKGNEAGMVYVINAQDCYDSYNKDDRRKKRNMLFTALTRSKSWVRVYGYGRSMELLVSEFEEIKKHKFALEFVYPDANKRKQMNMVHRDDKKRDNSKFGGLENFSKNISGLNTAELLKAQEELLKLKEALDKEMAEKTYRIV
jgi:superfamily I DNA and RNA helicase